MNERIKKLRKELDLTQQEFSDRLGIKRGAVANYELGRNEPIDAVVSLICREFSVNEVWLRTGAGEMFVKITRDEEIATFIGRVLSGETETFQRRLISVLSKLSENEWELLENRLMEIVGVSSAETQKD